MIASALLALLPAALANDAAVGGSGAAIYPVGSTELRLVRELVLFQEQGDSMLVTADLHFRNESARDLTVPVGFPARASGGWEGDPEVHDLGVWVDGEPAPVERVAVDPATTLDGWWEEVFLFEVRFPARADVQVLHSYRLTKGLDVVGTAFTQYILRTGRGWAGSIGEARFVFRFARPPAGLKVGYADRELALRDGGEPGRRGRPAASYVAGPTPTLELRFEDFEPAGDLWLSWGGDPFLELPARADPEQVDVPCFIQLQGWYAELARTGHRAAALPGPGLLACYEPGLLRELLLVARGQAPSAWREALTGRFPESALPYDPAWLSEAETLAIEALGGL